MKWFKLIFLTSLIMCFGCGCQTYMGTPVQYMGAPQVVAAQSLTNLTSYIQLIQYANSPAFKKNPYFAAYGIERQPDSARVLTRFSKETIELIVENDDGDAQKAGVKHLRNSDWVKAERAFGEALRINPNNHKSLFGLGVCRELRGDQSIAATKSLGKDFEVLKPKILEAHDFYLKALEKYKEANFASVNSKYEISQQRIKSKIEETDKYIKGEQPK